MRGCSVIGERWHYAPMAKRLAQAGILTAVIGYSLYPQASSHQMGAEVSQALSWIQDHAMDFGGSPEKVRHPSDLQCHWSCCEHRLRALSRSHMQLLWLGIILRLCGSQCWLKRDTWKSHNFLQALCMATKQAYCNRSPHDKAVTKRLPCRYRWWATRLVRTWP